MPKVKKKSKRKFLLFIVFIIIFVGILFVAWKFLDTNIKNIYIYDNHLLSDKEVIELAGISDYPDFFKTTSLSMRKKIEKSPYIKEVKIKKKFFGEVHIYIEEYDALFVRIDTKKMVLGNGKEVDYDHEVVSIPMLINYVPDAKYKTLIKRFSRLDERVVSKISEIKYDPNEYDEDRFMLYMNDGNYVYVTLTKMYLLDKYNEAVTKFEGKKGILYLDSGNYFKIIE